MVALKSTLTYDPQTRQLGDVGDPATYDSMQGPTPIPTAFQNPAWLAASSASRPFRLWL